MLPKVSHLFSGGCECDEIIIQSHARMVLYYMAHVTLKYGDIWEDLIKSHEPLRAENHLRLVAEEGNRESQSWRETQHTILALRWGWLLEKE